MSNHAILAVSVTADHLSPIFKIMSCPELLKTDRYAPIVVRKLAYHQEGWVVTVAVSDARLSNLVVMTPEQMGTLAASVSIREFGQTARSLFGGDVFTVDYTEGPAVFTRTVGLFHQVASLADLHKDSVTVTFRLNDPKDRAAVLEWMRFRVLTNHALTVHNLKERDRTVIYGFIQSLL